MRKTETALEQFDTQPAPLTSARWISLARQREHLERAGLEGARRALKQPVTSQAVLASVALTELSFTSPVTARQVAVTLARFVEAWGLGEDLDLRLLLDRRDYGLGHQAGYLLLEMALDRRSVEELTAEAQAALSALTPVEPRYPFLAERHTEEGLREFLWLLPRVVSRFRINPIVRAHVAAAESPLTYRPARWFADRGISSDRLRKAASPARKSKHVRKRGSGRDVAYCVEDVREHWPGDFRERDIRESRTS